jgi:hypothetical protein
LSSKYLSKLLLSSLCLIQYDGYILKHVAEMPFVVLSGTVALNFRWFVSVLRRRNHAMMPHHLVGSGPRDGLSTETIGV